MISVFNKFNFSAFGKDLLLTVLSKSVAVVISLIFELCVARYFNIELFGVWNWLIVWFNLFVIIALMGNETYLIKRFINTSLENHLSLILTVCVQSLFVFVVLSVTFILFFHQHLILVSIGFLYCFLMIFNKIINAFLIAKFNNFVVDQMSALSALIKVIFLLIIMFLPSLSVVLGYLLAELIVFFLISMYVINHFPYLFTKKPVWLGKVFDSWFLLNSFLPFLLLNLNLMMLKFWMPLSDIAGYAVAMKLSGALIFFFIIFNPFLARIAESFNKGSLTKLNQEYLLITKIIMVLLTPFCVFLFVYAPDILRLWGEVYVPYNHLLRVLVVVQFVDLFLGPLGSLLVLTEFEKKLVNILLILIPLNFLINLIFFPNFGLLGAGYSMLLVTMLLVSLKMLAVRKFLGILVWSKSHTIILFFCVSLLLVNLLFLSSKSLLMGALLVPVNILTIAFFVFQFRLITINELKGLIHD